MAREILEGLADFFGNKAVDVAMGAIVGLISYSQALHIATVIGLTVLTGAACVVIGVLLKRWSEVLPANITIEPVLNNLLRLPRMVDGDMLIDAFATLRVVNNEHSPLTDFYALLTRTLYGSHEITTDIGNQGIPRIKWRGTEESQVTIDAHGGEQMLDVYRVTQKHDKAGNNTISHNGFNTTGVSPIGITLGTLFISVVIELRGTLEDRSVRGHNFEGYVKLVLNRDGTGQLSVQPGKPTQKEIDDANQTRTVKGATAQTKTPD